MNDIRHECEADIRFMKRMRFWRQVLTDVAFASGIAILCVIATSWA